MEQVKLERSFHVATLDYDKDEIEARTVGFVSRRAVVVAAVVSPDGESGAGPRHAEPG